MITENIEKKHALKARPRQNHNTVMPKKYDNL